LLGRPSGAARAFDQRPRGPRTCIRSLPRTCSRRCARRSSCSDRCSTRCGEANMALPGGDDFGQRPINFHTDGLSGHGRDVPQRPKFDSRHEQPFAAARHAHHARVPEPHRDRQPADGLRAGRGPLGHRQRRSRARGRGPGPPAHRPWARRIEGLGTSRLTIDGVERLSPARHEVIPDRVVSGDVPGVGPDHRGRGAGRRRPGRPHGDAAAQARGHGRRGGHDAARASR
jgi:hypothetical protein